MERYSRQIKETHFPQAYGQNFVDGAATGVNVAGAWGRLGETIQKAGEVMRRRQDEWDTTRAMEANNEFMKRMTAYMDDPDIGVVNTRKLGLAQGLTKQADTDFDRFVSEIENTLENDAQKQAFRAMAERSRVPFWKQASHFEVSQVKEYRGQVFKNTLDAGMQMTMRDPMDEGAFEAASVQGATAIRAQYVGADEKVVNAAIDEYVSSLEAARIAAVSDDNPLLGESLIKSSPYLIPEDAKKLRGAIGPKAEIYRRQEAVDDLVQRFGPGQEQEGLAWIREHKSGEEEERLASAYKQRIGELTVKEVNAEAELRKQQVANFDDLYKRTWGMGQPPSLEEVTQAMMSGKISTTHHEKIKRWLEVDYSRAGIEKELSASPGWYDLTPQQQEERVLIAAGRSKKDNEAAIADIKVGILNGTITEFDITDYSRDMWITSQQENQLKQMLQAQKGKPQQLLKRHMAELETDLMNVFSEAGSTGDFSFSEIRAYVTKDLARRSLELDPNSKTYPEDLKRIRRESLLEGIKLANQPEKAWSWTPSRGLFSGVNVITPFGQRVEDAKKNIANFNESPSKGDRDIRTADLPDVGLPRQGVSRTGNIGLDMVSGGRITGRFYDPRPHRKGQHNGIDVAAPEGTPIVSPDMGVPLTVFKVVTNNPKRSWGNHVVLHGMLSDGRKVEMTIGHMKNESVTIKPGDVVNPGDLIGLVGNTGMTTDRSKGGKVTAWYPGKKSGYHMDLKIKIDGKYVDPETLQLPAEQAQPPTPTQPKGPAMKDGVQLGPTREAAAKLEAQEGEELVDSILFGGKDGI